MTVLFLAIRNSCQDIRTDELVERGKTSAWMLQSFMLVHIFTSAHHQCTGAVSALSAADFRLQIEAQFQLFRLQIEAQFQLFRLQIEAQFQLFRLQIEAQFQLFRLQIKDGRE
ncbi:hypothetical protein AK812_SmicGene15594 [Symbiodinium microadriaticum]|uniref:Uncharacterized protein n=1 Tax=Symbiodinium microadriaticum TaxID=2951 RepID=A0A1Q9E2H7_SYMMI|nr:hypothetical protein AK812_SmicGene15594 [Symbiodinium microadriaticum]